MKAWQFADELVVAVYEVTKHFPTEERYSLVTQMRRAAVSVAANIAEGATRRSLNEYLQFLSIAKGSLAELEYYLHLSRRLGYVDELAYQQLQALHNPAARTLHGLLNAVGRHQAVKAPFVAGTS